jgi:hypothetical protein
MTEGSKGKREGQETRYIYSTEQEEGQTGREWLKIK